MTEFKAHDQQTPTRRDFLQVSTAVGAAALGAASLSALAVPRSVHAAGTDETIRVGLVGCGNRGSGAAIDAMAADSQVRLVALADAFADSAQNCLKRLTGDETYGKQVAVEPDRIYTGFDAYKQLIDSGVDVVLLATPPHFRPLHFKYAVAQGKHCFVEKPIAVDAPGVREVMRACEEAKSKSLSIVSGLCYRYDACLRECVRQVVEEKAVGDVVAIDSRYLTGSLWHRGDEAAWSRMEYEVRNWLYFTWLSGDHIMEQAIHSIDKTAWILGDIAPISCTALGGRQQRTDAKYGNVYDHFTALYEYPGGVRVTLSCRQQEGCAAETQDRIMGTKGVAELMPPNHVVDRSGKETWRYHGPKPSMYRSEHDALFASIRKGEPINNGNYMCNSTLLALMGRQAAYTGAMIKWDDLVNDNERLGPTKYEWGDAPEVKVAIPGKAQVA